MDKVRFVNSGTEAVMTTIRVARAYTKRNKIIKFAGATMAIPILSSWRGSGPSTLGIPDSAGIPASIATEVITVPLNDLEGLRAPSTRGAMMWSPLWWNRSLATSAW